MIPRLAPADKTAGMQYAGGGDGIQIRLPGGRRERVISRSVVTAALTVDNTCRRSLTNIEASEGWGFESLRARSIIRRSGVTFSGVRGGLCAGA